MEEEAIKMKETILEAGERNECVIKVFSRMFLGLLVTAIIAFITYKTNFAIVEVISFKALSILELVLVFVFSFMFKRLSPLVVTILYYTYAVMNGVTMSVIFAVFEMETIYYAFLTTSLLFGGLALYGKVTKRDVTRIGSICLTGLTIGIIVSLINLFIGNTMVDIILDWVMLIIFCGLTIYDMKKITIYQESISADREKLYIYGAMDLYLDFIVIFLRILSLFGSRKK